MWKTILLLTFHRVCLILVAVFAIQKSNFFTLKWKMPKILSTAEVLNIALARIGQFPEFRALREGQVSITQPLLWLSNFCQNVTGLSSSGFFFILSNIFFFLFLRELLYCLQRMVPQETAEKTVTIAVLWPSAFLLNIGSSLSLSCFLTVYSLRSALDSRWLFAGLSVALLSFCDPFGIALTLLLLCIFFAFERHLPARVVAKRSALFLAPLVVLAILQWPSYRQFWSWLRTSGFVNAYYYSIHKGSVAWAFSESTLSQTLSALFVMVGAVSAMLGHNNWIHRTIPIYLGMAMLLLSPYGSLSSRALLAAASFEGVASLTAKPLVRLLNVALTWFGAYTVYRIFTVSVS